LQIPTAFKRFVSSYGAQFTNYYLIRDMTFELPVLWIRIVNFFSPKNA
jgi:hypothetical protein